MRTARGPAPFPCGTDRRSRALPAALRAERAPRGLPPRPHSSLGRSHVSAGHPDGTVEHLKAHGAGEARQQVWPRLGRAQTTIPTTRHRHLPAANQEAAPTQPQPHPNAGPRGGGVALGSARALGGERVRPALGGGATRRPRPATLLTSLTGSAPTGGGGAFPLSTIYFRGAAVSCPLPLTPSAGRALRLEVPAPLLVNPFWGCLPLGRCRGGVCGAPHPHPGHRMLPAERRRAAEQGGTGAARGMRCRDLQR